jgi:hypothetical protein
VSGRPFSTPDDGWPVLIVVFVVTLVLLWLERR